MELSRKIFFTPNVNRLVDFYISHFGLRPIGRPHAEWTELDAGACNLALHRTSEKTDGADKGVKIGFTVDDVAGEKARFESLGIKMTKIFKFGDIEMCDGSDPDGNRFQISSRG